MIFIPIVANEKEIIFWLSSVLKISAVCAVLPDLSRPSITVSAPWVMVYAVVRHTPYGSKSDKVAAKKGSHRPSSNSHLEFRFLASHHLCLKFCTTPT